MIEFIKSCYLWVAENYKEIIMTLTSAQFVSLISAIVLLIRSTRKTAENTDSSKALSKSLEDVGKTSETIQVLKSDIAKLKKDNESLKKTLTDNQNTLIDFLNTHSSKLNAMLEVQSVVYSTIKDEKIRSTVNGLLVNAKYTESTSRAKLQKEVEELREKVMEKVNDVTKDVDKAVDAVKGIVSTENTYALTELGKSDDITRY